MQFVAAASENSSSVEAAEELMARVETALAKRVDVAFLFFSVHHCTEAAEVAERLWLQLDPQCLVGCSAEGVIGPDREVERSPAMAILAGHMPGVRVHPFHIGQSEWGKLLGDTDALSERIGLGRQTRAIIGFGDPFTTPLHQWTTILDHLAGHAPLVGGMASAAQLPGENVLIRNEQTFEDGFVGATLSGPIQVQTVVSQGANPIGRTFVITKAHDNVIEQLGGMSALAALRQVVQSLPPAQQEVLRQGLLVGRAISEYRENFGRGDFLVRNIVSIDQDTGAIAIGDYVRVGQTVQFHSRGAATADEDLRHMLQSQSQGPPAAGLIFSCNSRGTRLFDQPGHDITVAGQSMPGVPLAGFFAAGELGPVGGKNFVHGHTASFALLRPQ